MQTVEFEGTVPVKVNGKPVKASFMNAWRKAEKTSYWRVVTEPCLGRNLTCGYTAELTPLEATIYAWVMGWALRYERYGFNRELLGAPVQAFDSMRYFFRSLNEEAYMDLLD
jgi:hypothetical protein